MAWTELTRRQHARVGDKYASDLTDAEWALIEPLMPPLKTTGRSPSGSRRGHLLRLNCYLVFHV
jgi:transposase